MTMEYKRLFILVEGDDDERFFSNVTKPSLEEKYACVKITKHAKLKAVKIRNFLNSIRAMRADYIFVTDINRAPCVTEKKRKLQAKISNIDQDRIMVVRKEIESWYLAGLDDANSHNLGVPPFSTTDSVTKEQFDALIPNKFGSRIDFMSEILKCFSIGIAQNKNESLRYFAEKYDC